MFLVLDLLKMLPSGYLTVCCGNHGPFTDDFPIKTSMYNGFSYSYRMLNNQMVKKRHWNIHYLGNLCIKFFFWWWFLEQIQGFIKTKPHLRSGGLVIPMLHPPDHRRIPIVHRKSTWGKWHFLLTLVVLYITTLLFMLFQWLRTSCLLAISAEFFNVSLLTMLVEAPAFLRIIFLG